MLSVTSHLESRANARKVTAGLEEQICTAKPTTAAAENKSSLNSNELGRNWFIASFAVERRRRRSVKEECGLVDISRSFSVIERA